MVGMATVAGQTDLEAPARVVEIVNPCAVAAEAEAAEKAQPLDASIIVQVQTVRV